MARCAFRIPRLAFVQTLCIQHARLGGVPTTCSASASRVTETTADLQWGSASSAVFKVHYHPASRPELSSIRTVTRGTVRLRGLRPGTEYVASVRRLGDAAEDRVRFTTTGCVETQPGAGVGETGMGAEPVGELTELSRLEIRVGKILAVDKHPDADSLYVEKVDLGEEGGPRTIVSGLVKYVPKEELEGRLVVVLANLKPRAMRGVVSAGMLLCASDEGHERVDPLAPPGGCQIGELVTFTGHQVAPLAPGNRATKAFDRVVGDLTTGDDGVARFQNIEFSTSKGPCFSPQRIKGTIS